MDVWCDAIGQEFKGEELRKDLRIESVSDTV